MKSMMKLIVTMAIAIGAFSAGAFADLREDRIAKKQEQLTKVQAELSQINASLTGGARMADAEGKQLVVISATLASVVKSVSESFERDATGRNAFLKGLAAGLKTFAIGEGVIYGIDAGTLLYMQNVRSAEAARLQADIIELQTAGK